MRSQGGVGSGIVHMPLVSGHRSRVCSESFSFTVRLLLPLTGRNCRCGLPLWPPPRRLCSSWGAWEEWIRCGECCSPHLQRGGGQSHHQRCGARHGLGSPRHARRRLEVVVDGLSLFGCVQLALDTMVVSALHADGEDGGRFQLYARTPYCILHHFCPPLLSYTP